MLERKILILGKIALHLHLQMSELKDKRCIFFLITQLVSGRGKFWTQALWLQPLGSLQPLYNPLSEDFSCFSSEPRHIANA